MQTELSIKIWISGKHILWAPRHRSTTYIIGKTYYPEQRYENTHYTTQTVYFCKIITDHIPKHIYHFGKYLRMHYGNNHKI